MSKKISTKNSTEEEIDEILLKKGLTKTFSVGDIVIVKLKDESNPWPGKISQFFIQEIKQKKLNPLEDQYDPNNQTHTNKRRKQAKPQIKKQQLIYKVRYYGCQEYVYSEEKFIEPYTLQRQKQLEEMKNRTLSKALELARKEMSEEQKEKVDKEAVQKKKASTVGRRKNKTKEQDKTGPDQSHVVNTQQMQEKIQNLLENQSVNLQDEDHAKKNNEFDDDGQTQVEMVDKKAEKNRKVHQKILKLQQSLEKQAKKLRTSNLTPQPPQKSQQSILAEQPKTQKHIIKESKSQKNNNKSITVSQAIQTAQQKHLKSPKSQPIICEQAECVVKEEYVQENQQQFRQYDNESRTISNKSSIQSSEQQSSSNQQELESLFDTDTSHNVTVSDSLHHEDSTPVLPATDRKLRKSSQKIVKEEFLLDNILYKNKYQLLGVFSQLLDWFMTQVLWVDKFVNFANSQSQRNEKSTSFQGDDKKLVTLRKILDAEIFTQDELEKFECMQKMINIYKIGQLTQVKLIAQSGKDPSNSIVKPPKKSSKNGQDKKMETQQRIDTNKKLVKIYEIIKKQLKGFGKFSNLFAKAKNHSVLDKNVANTIYHEYSFTLNHPESIEQAHRAHSQFKKHGEETSSSDCVYNPVSQTVKSSRYELRQKSQPKNKLAIDYSSALTLSSNQIFK